MYYHFRNKRIRGVLSVLPENEYRFEDEAQNPDDVKSRRLKKIIGFGLRRRVKADTTLSDMLIFGVKKLINEDKLKKEEIGAIVVVTLTQDYVLPHISTIIHGELGLQKDVFCMDIPQACAGYAMGLIESFMLLDHLGGDKKVVLCTGEIFNRKTDENEPKFDEPSFGGDVANISVIENSEEANDIYASAFFDGSERNALLIEYGGFRKPMTHEMIDTSRAVIPCSTVSMDGTGVFNFVQREVPPAIKEIVSRAGHTLEDIDFFLFHQPNRFMLEKLANAIGVPKDKMPMDITEKYGNSDSGTIPMVMTCDVSEELKTGSNLCCLSGFGGGLAWVSIVMNIDRMDFCENVISQF